MDFLRNHAHLAGGDTRKARKTRNLANHGIRQEGKGPPHATPSIPLNHGISRHSLSILSNQNTHRVFWLERIERPISNEFGESIANPV